MWWNNKKLFFLFWFVIVVLYLPAHKAMLIDDGVTAFYDFGKIGAKGLLNSYNFGSFYHGYFLIEYILYALFKTNNFAWFMVFTALYAANAVLFYSFSKMLLQKLSIKNFEAIASISVLLFLLCPLNAENIVWAATMHYNICLLVLLYNFIWAFQFIASAKSTNYVLFLALNIFCLFTFEVSFLFPLVMTLFFVLLKSNGIASINFKTFFTKAIMPLLLLISFYFIALYFFKHTLMPHGGSGFGLNNAIVYNLQQCTKFVSKLVLLSGYYPLSIKQMIYDDWCMHFYKMNLAYIILFSTIIYFLCKKNKSIANTFMFFLAMTLLMLLPFSNRFFNFENYNNIRYTFLATPFMYLALVLFFYQVHKILRWFFISIYLCSFVFFTFQTIIDKQKSAILFHTIIQKFPNTPNKKLYLLNAPTMSNHSYMFWDKERLPIALYAYRNLDIDSNKLHQVLNYYSYGIADSFEVKKLNDSAWTFQLKSDGCWLMNESMGGISYSNDIYTCEVGEWGIYTLTFHRKLMAHEDVIYFNGHGFVSVK